VSRIQPTMFDSDRLTLEGALDLTAESLNAYGQEYRHWAIAFSGGKDSAAVLTAVMYLIKEGRVSPPESLTVLYSDTRMELPPLQASAVQMLAVAAERGAETKIVMPTLDDRFFVYMFGRGVPPPKNRFRWCTAQLKIEPMQNALVDLRDRTGEKILMLTGVRVGESAARDQRIAVSCGRDGGECGQGWFQESTPEAIADTLAPCLHWRLCHVSDWLGLWAPSEGWPTMDILNVYGMGNAEGDEIEAGARTGCVGCNLASKDTALDRVLRVPQWAHFHPLKRLKPLYTFLQERQNRLRKDGSEIKVDGTLVANPQRLGPLTMKARRHGLAEVLAIQDEVCRGGSPVDLINPEEHARILELIEANTWPNRWFGTEVTGDVILPLQFIRGGGKQHVMMFTGPDKEAA